MRWITILFALFIILIIVLADRGQLGLLGMINRIPYGDKAGHFILYGILAFLVDLTLFQAFPNGNRKRIAVISALTLAFLIGMEEFSQKYFATRTFSLVDLTASYVGLLFFSWLALRIRSR
jgi:VanZ family protein